MDEVPHRVVIHLETTLGQLGHQSAQGEGFLPDPVHKPGMVLALIAFGLCPPICPGATLPVCRKRRTQVIAVLIPTPNREAAARRDRPSSSTAVTTRSRRSTE